MHRLLAACLFVVFASLAATDTVACPDGCQLASSSSAADRCNDTGSCVFCCGGVVLVAAHIATAPQIVALLAPLLPVSAAPVRSAAVPHQPPRLA